MSVKMTLSEAKKALLKKEISSVELTKEHLNHMNKNRHLNAYVLETSEKALEMAKNSDEKIANGYARDLEGLPIGIKDLFCTKGFETTASSKMLAGFKPQYESTVSQNLWDNGAVMLGKLNMDEFAMGSSNMTSFQGPAHNPWREKHRPEKELVPGGSSGGSSSAVAADMCLMATGSDTGGSIRQPAAFTGLVGIKPTYGLCSRYGMVAFSSSLDQAGPLCKSVEDAALSLRCMASYDEKDATSLNVSIPKYEENLNSDIKGMRIGVVPEYVSHLSSEMKAIFENSVENLRKLGAEIKEIHLKTADYGLPAYYILASAECSSNLARYDGVRFGYRTNSEFSSIDEMYELTRAEGFGDEVKKRILIGTYVLSQGHFEAYYMKSQKIRTLIARDFDNAFKDVDIIYTPTTPTSAFAEDEKPTDPVTMYLNDMFTVNANLAGIPGISIPVALDKKGLPVGGQFLGPRFSEQSILNASLALEKSVNFSDLRKTATLDIK